MSPGQKRILFTGIGLSCLMLVILPFALYSIQLGMTGIFASSALESRFFAAGHAFGNRAVFGHMLLGGLLTFLIPLQLFGPLRRRFPALHRWCGRLLCGSAILTGLGGLAYIYARGTIGGRWMDTGFALYGLLLMLSAVVTVRFARAGQYIRHRRWALRLFVLSMGSWLYRVHYGVWFALTDGLGSTPRFDGIFDLVQNAAFYLPYLVLLEVWLRWPQKPATA